MNPDMIHSLNSLRVLSLDMITYAKSGHPGICLGAAPIIYSLFANQMKIHPEDPTWPNRDRFVLSAGHGSALLYAMLFMAGYDISIDDLVEYRKIGSKTPGHPEYNPKCGVEISTGALGEGFANAVGMAISGKYLKGILGEVMPKQNLVNYYVYCMVSDGDLEEGVANEAASLAGHLALNNLIVLYDSNDITLDGELKISSSEKIIEKYMQMGWDVDYVAEGNDIREIDKAIERAKVNKKPTLIEVKTILGRGSKYEGKNIVHGKPLSKEDVESVKKYYNMNTQTLEITENAVKYVRESIAHRNNDIYAKWQKDFEYAKNNCPNEPAKKILDFIETGADGLTFNCNSFKIQNDYNEELRESNSKMMNIISDRSKFFLGGSADVSLSCHTALYKELSFSPNNPTGKNINFGVREHAMGAILNGMSVSGLRVFGSTFLTFADYLKPSMRMACMMNLPITYIFTHDSIRVGEDGPSHQPIEQLSMLRTIPNLTVFRPCDINEVLGTWDYVINHKKPVAIVLSKDEAHILAGTSGEKTKHGAYIVKSEKDHIDAVVISTGIDFTKAYLITEELRASGFDLRLVSMPSMDIFLHESIEYRESVIPKGVKVFTIEAGSTLIWNTFASPNCAIGIDEFGYSGSKDDVEKKLNFDYESIIARMRNELIPNSDNSEIETL